MSASAKPNLNVQSPVELHPRGNGTPEPPRFSLWRLVLIAIVFGIVISGIGIGIDALLINEQESRRVVIEASDAFTGIIAGLLFLRLLMVYRTRQLRVRERLNAISALNDQIRNSLQIISLTAHALPEQKALDVIDKAVVRIESSLREVAPKI
jgi:hypothetical protein